MMCTVRWVHYRETGSVTPDVTLRHVARRRERRWLSDGRGLVAGMFQTRTGTQPFSDRETTDMHVVVFIIRGAAAG